MEINADLIEADVHYSDPTRDRYFVRITFVGTGLYINSFSVSPSKHNDEYWVQKPKFNKGNKWMSHVDFDNSSALWQIIVSKAREAVTAYKNESVVKSDNTDLDDFTPKEKAEADRMVREGAYPF